MALHQNCLPRRRKRNKELTHIQALRLSRSFANTCLTKRRHRQTSCAVYKDEYRTNVWNRILYEVVPEGPLRELVLDLFTWKKTANLLKKKKYSYHKDFLQDLVVRLKEKELRITWRAPGMAPWLQDPCKYHKHTGREKMECKKRKR